MKPSSTAEELDRVIGVVEGLGLAVLRLSHGDREIVRLTGYADAPQPTLFEGLPGVELVAPIDRPLHRVLRSSTPDDTVVRAGSVAIGGGSFTIVAGPCAVESEDQLDAVARTVAGAGADLLRGGAYKPRTSPYEFQGLGGPGLEMLARASERHDLPLITEAIDEGSLDGVERCAGVVQIGARNMQNFALLKRVGASRLPVLLKRAMSASLEDLLGAAEYLMDAGNPNVILCERGIRTFSAHSRFTLDLSIVPVLKRLTHLPVFVDPSHASGHAKSVPPLALAALAAGADGVMVEVHPDPDRALCDGPQSLSPDAFVQLAASLRALEPVIVRRRETVS